MSEVGVLLSFEVHIANFHLPHLFKFYCEPHANIGEKYARFAFCKDVDTLKKAAERLRGLKKYM